MSMKHLIRGAVAGAAGTTALNAATYFDMVARGRPASETPEATIERMLKLVGLDVPGGGERRRARISGLGALTGIGAGVGTGVVLGELHRHTTGLGPWAGILASTAAATIAGNGPMTGLGVTDPRQWSVTDWAADLIPHLAYGVAAWLTLTVLEDA